MIVYKIRLKYNLTNYKYWQITIINYLKLYNFCCKLVKFTSHQTYIWRFFSELSVFWPFLLWTWIDFPIWHKGTSFLSRLRHHRQCPYEMITKYRKNAAIRPEVKLDFVVALLLSKQNLSFVQDESCTNGDSLCFI